MQNTIIALASLMFGFHLLWSLSAGAASAAEKINAPFTNDDQTMLLLHFDGNLNDASKFACHGAGSKILEYATGRFGQAVLGNGKTWIKVIEAAGGENLSFAGDEGPLTIELWVNPKGHTMQTIPLARRTTGAPWGFLIINGQLAFGQWAPGRWTSVQSKMVLPLGEWSHVALTVDSRTMLTSFFLNGKLIQQFDLAAPLGCNIKGEPVWIMGKEDAETPTAKFQGLIDELRISRCIRYDPDGTAKVDTQVFEVTPSLTMPIIETKEMP